MSKHLEQIKVHLRTTDSPFLRKRLTENLQAELLRESIRGCTGCDLSESRTQAVPFTGPTHGRSDLVLLGEAPGQVEDESGVPFMGRSGELLNSCLEKAGTSRTRVTIVNTLCCRPPKNSDPEPHQLIACQSNLTKQLAMSRTWVGVALGGFALASLIGADRESIKVRDYLDKPVWVDGRVWFATFHPSYALRGVLGAKAQIISSLRAAMALKLGRAELPPFSYDTKAPNREADYYAALKDARLLLQDGLAERVAKKGWYFTHHPVFDAHILVVRDETVAYKKSTPEKFKSYPVYTVEELIRLGESAVKNGWSVQALRRLHMVKTEFNGLIVA